MRRYHRHVQRSLRNLKALDDSSDFFDRVHIHMAKGRGRCYICTDCGNEGVHLLATDSNYRLCYRCADCKDRGVNVRGIPTFGSVSAMFVPGSGCKYDADWESNELFENEIASSAYRGNNNIGECLARQCSVNCLESACDGCEVADGPSQFGCHCNSDVDGNGFVVGESPNEVRTYILYRFVHTYGSVSLVRGLQHHRCMD